MKKVFHAMLFLQLVFQQPQIGNSSYTVNTDSAFRNFQYAVDSSQDYQKDSLSSIPDLVLRANPGFGLFGWAQSEFAGDVNGDGFDDVLIRSRNVQQNQDMINLYFGNSILDSISDLSFISDLTDYDYLVTGSISILLDVNGDGFDDILIGAPSYNSNSGRAYLYFGGVNIDNNVDIIFESPTGGAFGNSVSSAGDLNNDGYGDFIIGAYGFGTGYQNGNAYIYFGGPIVNSSPSLVLPGLGGLFGHEVSDAGDVNADGFDDVIIGAPLNGKAYIFLGGVTMNSVPDVVFESSGGTGFSVSAAGDVNSDGFDDVLIGNEGGIAYVLLGALNMNNSPDVIFSGPFSFGKHVSNCGDVNSDGYDDIIIGTRDANRIEVYFGGEQMDNQSDFSYTGTVFGDFGYHVGHAGDFNGDGASDFLGSAPTLSPGSSALFLGISNSNLTLNSPPNSSINLDLSIDFVWSRYQSANSYHLSVATDPQLNSLVYSDSTITDTNKTVYLNTYSTTYFWRISARDSTGNLRNSAVWNFTTRSRPVNQLIYPENEATEINLSETFIWEGITDVSDYRVLISLDSTFQNIVFIDSVFNDTTITISGFSYLTKYFWKVGAKDTSGLFYYSDLWNFTTIPRPLVQLIRPIDDSLNASTNMNFVWGSVPYATSYRLQIAIDSTFNNVQYNYTGLSDTSKLVLGLSHNQRYFWRVGAKELSGPTYYSTYRDFTTMPQLRLNVTVLMEGMYFPLFNQLSRKDSVRVILRQSNAPYSVVDSATATIDSLNYTGLFVFPKASAGRYYIVVKHFNCVETWSRAGGEELIGGITNAYNFTTSASQAYGSNLKLRGGKYCMYSGDINQSGFIDGTDLSELDNGAYNLLSGRFLPTDLNGDNFTDGTDFVIGDNNRSYIGVITP